VTGLLSRFAALSVSLTLQVSLFQVSAACEIGQPAIQLWQANGDESGALGAVVVNYARTPVTFSASLDVSALLSTSSVPAAFARAVRIQRRGAAGQPDELAVDADGFATLSKTLPPLTAALFDVHVQ